MPADLPPHVSRVVRAAVAWALGEPGVGAASAELLAAVSEMRRINGYQQMGECPEREKEDAEREVKVEA
jgi:proteasome assembly chaperone (PAC2) family protein